MPADRLVDRKLRLGLLRYRMHVAEPALERIALEHRRGAGRQIGVLDHLPRLLAGVDAGHPQPHALVHRERPGLPLADLDRGLVAAAVESIKTEYDSEYGGFGSPGRGFRGTKFPVPPYLQLALYEADRTHSSELTEIVTGTLDHMARGGIYDQLGGGFHRYSTERTWTVPHFEKMLYDNAQLLEVYARAWGQTGKPLYRQVAREIIGFIQREMTSPEGAFYSALDAETNGEEGRYYVWTDEEIDRA